MISATGVCSGSRVSSLKGPKPTQIRRVTPRKSLDRQSRTARPRGSELTRLSQVIVPEVRSTVTFIGRYFTPERSKKGSYFIQGEEQHDLVTINFI